jgi:DNA polymerase I-like protein with 3'-5' exonuclease and polymerase domains
MSFAYDNQGSHALKDLGIKYLNIDEDDKEALKTQVMACRKLADMLGWKIANAENQPYTVGSKGKEYWAADMWLPAAVRRWLDANPQEVHLLNSLPDMNPFVNLCNIYCLRDTERTLYLGQFLEEQFNKTDEVNLWDSYELNRKQLPVIWGMEEHGLPVLMDKIDSEQSRLNELANTFKVQARTISGYWDLNLNSPQQVARVLLGRFNYVVPRTTANDELTIDKDEAEELYDEVDKQIVMGGRNDLIAFREFLFCYMGYKKCTKASDQDLARYKRMAIKTDDGRHTIHFSYNPSGADTGRYSSDGSQNIGKGKNVFNERIKALGLNLRAVFGPGKGSGKKWISNDGKQLQVVIAAFTSNEKALMNAVLRGDDLHDFTQIELAKVLGRAYDPKDDGQRTLAKTCNFTYLFGGGEGKVDSTAHYPGLYPLLRELFPDAHRQIRTDIKFLKEHGYIMAGPVRLHVPSDAPYSATVYRIQGLEAVIIKHAMRLMWERTYYNDFPFDLILSVHDDILNEVPIDCHPDLPYWYSQCIEEAGLVYGIPCKSDIKIIETDWASGTKPGPRQPVPESP